MHLGYMFRMVEYMDDRIDQIRSLPLASSGKAKQQKKNPIQHDPIIIIDEPDKSRQDQEDSEINYTADVKDNNVNNTSKTALLLKKIMSKLRFL
ncbi:hypothetical protein GLOIN_2v1791647 [Rhizophagus irregularis DAOM 181602=DAOM 197198]|uniref:Uncharacterized protein n=1 Tax=Rhizophagus irregularis (strain DAOM 181602 / DAOM 197198 / MUCL 43194) TaxID=747089 RepID=A0A2P4NVX3_RHIID|nr:hypothetical protein GLOIN_2v1791647 [Rhizophagus irregularis DAOM 181602=DAOM 197198]POG57292.1 hypothetical protein GLOIN_2v1791647 [Rhizophagus irregularis DAOM 181602=DAOM 197198]|eukprot:XP_025164433.1 hypothetical protein GLOIN_2v1791647 [Rhizophagus irregularis DAOM 181602=DAOM 197198]